MAFSSVFFWNRENISDLSVKPTNPRELFIHGILPMVFSKIIHYRNPKDKWTEDCIFIYIQAIFEPASEQSLRTEVLSPVFAYLSCIALQPPLVVSPKSLLSTCNSVSFVFERDCNTTPPLGNEVWGAKIRLYCGGDRQGSSKGRVGCRMFEMG